MMQLRGHVKSGLQAATPKTRGVALCNRFLRWWNLSAVAVCAITLPELLAANSSEAVPPSTPREYFNDGTAKLRARKLKEAETLLETALASQNERLQPPALYNLGHVRFQTGAEELKKGPSAGAADRQGRAAASSADNAMRAADTALAGDEVDKVVAAYLNGRGARRELKAAKEVVKRALQSYGAALTHWQRSSGDFKSTAELDSADNDAQQNADVVDRCIAKLVDSLRDLQQLANALGEKDRDLGQKLKKLKGRMPASDAPPGGGGEDDEDEDQPFGPKPGQKEGATKEGEQMTLSPEQAGWLLEGYKLDSERRLPMGQGPEAEPRKRSQKTW